MELLSINLTAEGICENASEIIYMNTA